MSITLNFSDKIQIPHSINQFKTKKISGNYFKLQNNLLTEGSFSYGSQSGIWTKYDSNGNTQKWGYQSSRVGATCWDGSRSYATGRGACSHHGGVKDWLYQNFKVNYHQQNMSVQQQLLKQQKITFQLLGVPVNQQNFQQSLCRFFKKSIVIFKGFKVLNQHLGNIMVQLQQLTNNNNDFQTIRLQLQDHIQILKKQKIQLQENLHKSNLQIVKVKEQNNKFLIQKVQLQTKIQQLKQKYEHIFLQNEKLKKENNQLKQYKNKTNLQIQNMQKQNNLLQQTLQDITKLIDRRIKKDKNILQINQDITTNNYHQSKISNDTTLVSTVKSKESVLDFYRRGQALQQASQNKEQRIVEKYQAQVMIANNQQEKQQQPEEEQCQQNSRQLIIKEVSQQQNQIQIQRLQNATKENERECLFEYNQNYQSESEQQQQISCPDNKNNQSEKDNPDDN